MKTRSRRRALLSLLVMAVASPGYAGEPSAATAAAPTTSMRMLPPLPLQPIQTVSHDADSRSRVQANPFYVDDSAGNVDNAILLASGDDAPAVRLKPIGAAIGLHPIGSPKIPGAEMLIESVPLPAVQTNPLIESVHHENNDLVNADVEVTFRPPVKHGSGSAPPSADVATESHAPADTQALVPMEPAESEMAESEPICFSFSDSSDSMTIEARTESADSFASHLQKPIGPEPVADQPLVKQRLDIVPVVLDEQPSVTEAIDTDLVHESNDVDSSSMVGGPSVLAMPPMATDHEPNSAEPILMMEPEDLLQAPVREALMLGEGQQANQLLKKRYRPPVAVESPPASFQRPELDATASIVRPTVQAVRAPVLTENSNRDRGAATEFKHGTQPLAGTGTHNKPTPLYISRAQVRSLTIQGELRRVSVGDQSVCRALASGSNQIKLIGAGNGVTRLVVWADTADASPTKVRHFDIHVQDAVDASGDAVGDKVSMLNRTIGETFPSSNVQVQQEGNDLVIRGHCTSEETAKKIVRMVRKTCLIPVRDELNVR
ncbi:pilus assembly protein N-terminal domain-containing protein [Novipirellula artificiosorum]|nr:pilus assembly protein N-terminal domain-containing protein [Novipirellula artificiosorum]